MDSIFSFSSMLQKKLLRYVLNQLNILDPESITLQSVDFTLGKNSVIELHDAKLSVQSLSSLISLRRKYEITSAQVSTLRINLPADLYTSSIHVEIHGVNISIKLAASDPPNANNTDSSSPQSPHFTVDSSQWLPDSKNLARSFLFDEPDFDDDDIFYDCQSTLPSTDETSPHCPQTLPSLEPSSKGENNGNPSQTILRIFANWIRGLGKRLTLCISNVNIQCDSELLFDDTILPRRLRTDGFTSKSTLILNVDSIKVSSTLIDTPPSTCHSLFNTSSCSSWEKRLVNINKCSLSLSYTSDPITDNIPCPFNIKLSIDAIQASFSLSNYREYHINTNVWGTSVSLNQSDFIRFITTPQSSSKSHHQDNLHTESRSNLKISISHTDSDTTVQINTSAIHILIDLPALEILFHHFQVRVNDSLNLDTRIYNECTLAAVTPFLDQLKVNIRFGNLKLAFMNRTSSILFLCQMKLTLRDSVIAIQVSKTRGFFLKGKPGNDSPVEREMSTMRSESSEKCVTNEAISVTGINLLIEIRLSTTKKDAATLAGKIFSLVYNTNSNLLNTLHEDGLRNISCHTAWVEFTLDLLQVNATADDWFNEAINVATEFRDSLVNLVKYFPSTSATGPSITGLIRQIHVNGHVNPSFGQANLSVNNVNLCGIIMPNAACAVITVDEFNLLNHSNTLILGKCVKQDTRSMLALRCINGEAEQNCGFSLELHLTNLYTVYQADVERYSNLAVQTGKSSTFNACDNHVEASLGLLVQALLNLDPSFSSVPTQSMLSEPVIHITSQLPTQLFNVNWLHAVHFNLHDSVVALERYGITGRCAVFFKNASLRDANLTSLDASSKNSHPLTALSLAVDRTFVYLIDDITRGESWTSGNFEACAEACGYTLVGSIFGIEVSITSHPLDKSINVNVENRLAILDTCADSTVTLLHLLHPKTSPTTHPPNLAPAAKLSPSNLDDVEADFCCINSKAECEDWKTSSSEFDYENSDHIYMIRLDKFGDIYSDDGSYSGYESEKYCGESEYSEADSSTYGFSAKHDNDEDTTFKLNLRLQCGQIIWNMFDGYDWPETRKRAVKAHEKREIEAEYKRRRRRKRLTERSKSWEKEQDKESWIDDCLLNSVWVDVGNLEVSPVKSNDEEAYNYAPTATVTSDATDAAPTSKSTSAFSNSEQAQGHFQRSQHHKMTIELRNVSGIVQLSSCVNSGISRLSSELGIKEVEVFDHMPSSSWNKFATFTLPETGQKKRKLSKMFHLVFEKVQFNPASSKPDELKIRINVLPVRLHVDQDALEFLVQFFSFADSDLSSVKLSSRITQPSRDVIHPIIRIFEMSSLYVKLDYKPKKVDYSGLRAGQKVALLNFIRLDSAQIRLQAVRVTDVVGFPELKCILLDHWIPDIRKRQLPHILAGVAALRPLTNICGQLHDLIINAPGERRVKSSAAMFARTTTAEVIRLAAKLALGTQIVLEGAESALLVDNHDREEMRRAANSYSNRTLSRYANQPVSLIEGLRNAAQNFEKDFWRAHQTLLTLPIEAWEQNSTYESARFVARTAPTIIIRPAIGVSKALGLALFGASNSLDRDSQRKLSDKYKRL